MKKLLSLFSILMILGTNVLPTFTYADSWDNELAIQILTEELNNAGELFNNIEGINTTNNNENVIKIFGEKNNETRQWIEWIDFWKISIPNPDDPTNWITIMDRNLWAITNDIKSRWSYWNHYQWWNNYWFDSNKSENEINVSWWPIQIDSTITEYSWNTFLTWNWSISTWMQQRNFLLWTWESKQWPCPNWYHIPDKNEWKQLLKYYVRYYSWMYDDTITFQYQNQTSVKNEAFAKQFSEDLKLPLAWYRDYYTAKLKNQWKFWNYRSSSPYGETDKNYSSSVSLTSSEYRDAPVRPFNLINVNQAESNIYGISLRCFKDIYEIPDLEITYHPNWWAFSWMDVNERKEYTYYYNWTKIEPINNIQIPNKEPTWETWWMFAGWYTKDWTNNDWWVEFNPRMPTVNIVYAKRLPFKDLNIIDEKWNTIYTIMDRNLWAINNDITSTWSYWYHYQRWNNYWFNPENWLMLSKDFVRNTNIYGPWNYYYSQIFVKYGYDEENDEYLYYRDADWNYNLWWWKWDTRINRWKWNDIDRQWPCPLWYHIPSSVEMNSIYNLWCKNNKEKCLNNNISNFINDLKIPLAGYRWYDLKINKANEAWELWTSTRYDNETSNSLFVWWTIWANDTDDIVIGNSVRCIKNSEKNYNLEFVANNRTIQKNKIMWREPISTKYLINAPERENWRFLWWSISWSNEYFDFKDQYSLWTWSFINEDIVLYAKYECDLWYTSNSEWTACERIWINFDANWWIFNNWESKIFKEIPFTYTPYYETKISKTTNFLDDWTTNWNYSQWNFNNYIKITWANELNITIKYWWWPYQWIGPIWIWTGNHNDYNPRNPYHINSSILNITEFPTDWNYLSTWLSVSWDSLTIVQWSWAPCYWYFATVTWTGIAKWIEYTEQYHKNIENPKKEWHEFLWRYYTWFVEEFDTWNVLTGEMIKLYAKWNPYEYTIKFNNNWWIWVSEDINATYWVEIQLPTLTREWYIFKWWKSEDWKIYNNIIPEWTWVTTVNWIIITLTAQWEAISSSAWGGQSITPTKQETKVREQEHNSADTEDQKTTNTQTNTSTNNVAASEEIKQQVKKVEDRYLTRWEMAIMTNILLEIYPQLVKWKAELDDVTNACSNYADEQSFTKDEKKAITRLCKLSIMWIHNDTNEPLEEFSVNLYATNDEFSKVINRSIETYNEKDLSTIKNALKKLEWDEENVVFGTVYDMFMGIKNIFSN